MWSPSKSARWHSVEFKQMTKQCEQMSDQTSACHFHPVWAQSDVIALEVGVSATDGTRLNSSVNSRAVAHLYVSTLCAYVAWVPMSTCSAREGSNEREWVPMSACCGLKGADERKGVPTSACCALRGSGERKGDPMSAKGFDRAQRGDHTGPFTT